MKDSYSKHKANRIQQLNDRKHKPKISIDNTPNFNECNIYGQSAEDKELYEWLMERKIEGGDR